MTRKLKNKRTVKTSNYIRSKKKIKKVTNWDHSKAKEAEELVNHGNPVISGTNELKPTDKLSTMVPERKISQPIEEKNKTSAEVLEMLESLITNMEKKDELLLEIEKSPSSGSQVRRSNIETRSSKKTSDRPRKLKVTMYTRCPICGKARHLRSMKKKWTEEMVTKTNEIY